ncbi:Spt20 family-domain-containing protein [Rhizoctonia solani]|nr:Spt20 family-domain-containing protein [Rhizoctonia solani]
MTAVYNYKKREEQILARFAKSPPSFAVHLHSGHWTLNKENNARTFLYNSPAVSILDSIRAHQVPVDMLEMLDQANVPFYDGCLIVEEHDHTLATGETAPSDPAPSESKGKNQSNSVQKRRVVLYPNGETLWADISILNVRNGNTWTDQQAIEFEAKVLSTIAPPLCLDPDPIASKVASLAMNSTSLDSTKRKHNSLENDKRDDTARKAEHDKFMNVMNPRSTRIFHADFRHISWVEEWRRGEGSGERPGSPTQGSGPQASIAPTPTPPPGSASGLPESMDEGSGQKRKSKKKRDGPDSPMQVDAPSPGLSSANKPRKNSITQITPLPIGGGKKKQGQHNRRGTASSVEPSPANLVVQLPHAANGQVSAMDSPQSVQASPNPAMVKKDEMQSTLGIGIPPPTSHSPAPTGQQVVSGPPKKRMKTETPSMGNVPLPGLGSQQGTPQQSYIPLNPHLGVPIQQPNPTQPGIHRYSASPAPAPTVANNQQPQQYPGQLAHNYGPLGLNIANGMMFNNGTGPPGYNAVPGMQQPQMANMHANMFAAQNQQQQAVNQAGSPHPHPPSRPASQASVPMRNSPHPPQPMTLGGNTAPNLQAPQQGDQQVVRPASGAGQQGMQMNPGMHQPGGQMQMPVDQMMMLRQMQAQRMAYPGAQNMMQYPGFPMQMTGQQWQMNQLSMGRGQQLQQQYAAAMQRRGAMQAPPNPQR